MDGTLTVSPREVELTAKSAEKVYDGAPLTNDGFDITSGSFVGEEGLASVTVEGSVTDPGTAANKITGHELKGNTKAQNYDITYKDGTLTVTKVTAEIVVTAKSDSKVYDGAPLTNGGYTYTEGVLAEGDRIEATVEGAITDAGTAANKVTEVKVLRGEGDDAVDVTGNYTFGESVDGTLTVSPREVELIIPTQTKTYDGTVDVLGSEPIVLGFAPAAQMGEGFVAGDDLTVTIAPENVKFSQADVHTDGALIADIANVVATGEDAGNYTLRNISGIGSISEHGVQGFTLTASGYAGAYDGQEHAAVSSISVTGQYQPDTEWDLTFALSEDGEYTSDVPVVTNVSDSTTVWVKASNANYGEMTVSVEAQVTPLTLTVTANNQTKVAGTADPALTSTYTGALPGETPGWTGTIARVPGEAAGTYQIFQNTLGIEDNGAFLAGNYTLVFVNGTLTITAAPGGGDNPDDGGDDTPTTPTTPTTPGTTTDGGTPTVIEDAPEQPEPEQIDDDENPLAGPSESIDDDGTPLARPAHQDCWVHWLMILGIIVTAIYDVLVLIRRRKFTGTLASFEDEVLNDRNRNA